MSQPRPSDLSIDAPRLHARLRQLGAIGRRADGTLARLAATDEDRQGRDRLVAWMREAGLAVDVDALGNIFGTWRPDGAASDADPVMIGSHIDTVADAGIYDGAYGVLGGLAVVEALRASGILVRHPVTVAAFTNEEGFRFTPDMMGSLVHAGGLPLADALAARDADGRTLGAELARIGYAGPMAPGTIRPRAYLELHVEQGPILEHEGLRIGAVERLQGISWQRVTIAGEANHAGTTPMHLRRDAGYAAARVATFVRDLATESRGTTVATVGTLRLEPGAINVIPARATLTLDIRDADEARLAAAESAVAGLLRALAGEVGVEIDSERLVRFAPVTFDASLVAGIERAAASRGFPSRRMTSGAGHDAQMIARIAPAAMIFVPSRGGISHSPHEQTDPEDLAAGAAVLLDVVREAAGAEG